MAAISQTPGSVLKGASASTNAGTAGGTLTAGMPIYIDTADSNKIKACKADAAGTANCDGIVLNGASTGQPCDYQSVGDINLGATLVVGQVHCVSAAAAGAIVPYSDLTTAGYVTVLGVATTAGNLKLSIINSATAKP